MRKFSSKPMENHFQNNKKEKSEFTKMFEQFLENYEDWSEVLDIIRKNSYDIGREGRIWIIGGFVYRPIIKALYGGVRKPFQVDIDFLIERGLASEKIEVPKGWEVKRTEYTGYTYLEKKDGTIRIDPNPLGSFHSIVSVAKSMNSAPDFEHFFKATPLNIQAIAYDITTDKDKIIGGVIGEKGIEAIKNRIVKINNLEEAKFEAERRKMSLEDFVKTKAAELNFSWELPN